MLEKLIAEATEYDFKEAVKIRKLKSWLKSVSAFANGIGGTLIFGVDDAQKVVGLADAQGDAEAISRLIKERITPLPGFVLAPFEEDGKSLLALKVSFGRSTPYYYKADGITEAHIRVGNESIAAQIDLANQIVTLIGKRFYRPAVYSSPGNRKSCASLCA